MKAPALKTICLFLALFSALSMSAHEKYFLDLTSPERIPAQAMKGSGCGPRLSTGEANGGPNLTTVPLVVELVSLDRNAYSLGEDLICEVRLTNAGDKPVRIPWSRNPVYGHTDCSPDTKGGVEASLTGRFTLVLTENSGIKYIVLLKSLYGRLAIPATIRVLSPGQSARVKIKERVALFDPRLSAPVGSTYRLPQEFFATVAYDVDDTTQANPYRTVYSKNGAEVTILTSRSAH